MKFDTTILNPQLPDVATVAAAADALGFDGLWTAETNSDPFLPLAIAAEHSQRLNVGTAIAVTFPRSPTVLATILHGWNETAQTLGKMAVRGQWDEMPQQITDEMLDTFAITGTWADLPGKIKDRYGRQLTRISYYLPFVPGEYDLGWQASITGFRTIGEKDES